MVTWGSDSGFHHQGTVMFHACTSVCPYSRRMGIGSVPVLDNETEAEVSQDVSAKTLAL